MQGITLDKDVEQHFSEALATNAKALGIRVGVKRNGCSGLSHTLEFVYDKREHDLEFEQNKLKVFVDKYDFAKYLKGVHLVYKEDDINAGVEFVNPNAAGECGCGESFTVEQ